MLRLSTKEVAFPGAGLQPRVLTRGRPGSPAVAAPVMRVVGGGRQPSLDLDSQVRVQWAWPGSLRGVRSSSQPSLEPDRDSPAKLSVDH